MAKKTPGHIIRNDCKGDEKMKKTVFFQTIGKSILVFFLIAAGVFAIIGSGGGDSSSTSTNNSDGGTTSSTVTLSGDITTGTISADFRSEMELERRAQAGEDNTFTIVAINNSNNKTYNATVSAGESFSLSVPSNST